MLRLLVSCLCQIWYISNLEINPAHRVWTSCGAFSSGTPAQRLTAAEAQLHPWFAAQLGWEAESLRITAQLPAILDKVRTAIVFLCLPLLRVLHTNA